MHTFPTELLETIDAAVAALELSFPPSPRSFDIAALNKAVAIVEAIDFAALIAACRALATNTATQQPTSPAEDQSDDATSPARLAADTRHAHSADLALAS